MITTLPERPGFAPPNGVFRAPCWTRVRLPNGLRVAIHENWSVPLVRLRLIFPAGAQYDRLGKEGLASLATPLLRTGSTTRDSAAIGRAFADLGSDLVTAVDWETGSLTIDLLSDDLERGLGLLLDVGTNPSFDAPVVESSRRTRIRQLGQRLFEPAVLATDWFARAIYGYSPYGSSLLGTERGLASLTRDDLFAFHRTHFALGCASLLVAGSVDTEDLLDRLHALSRKGYDGDAPRPPALCPQAFAAPAAYLVDFPNAGCTELRLGHVGVAQSDPDLIGLQVLNAVLGGSQFSRLSRNLRQQHAFSYSVHGRFVPRTGPGPFFVTTCVRNEHAGAAAREIFGEIQRIQDQPALPSEIQAAQSQLAASLVEAFHSNSDVIDRLMHLETHQLADDHFERCLAEVRQVDAVRVMELARRHLHLEQMVVVAAGPAKELRRQMGGREVIEDVLPRAPETYFQVPLPDALSG